MKEVLSKRGYVKDEELGGWRKDDWVVRFTANEVEVFNDPVTKSINKYFCKDMTEVNLIVLLNEIDDYLQSK